MPLPAWVRLRAAAGAAPNTTSVVMTGAMIAETIGATAATTDVMTGATTAAMIVAMIVATGDKFAN